MKKIAESVLCLLDRGEKDIRSKMLMSSGEAEIYPDSVHKSGNNVIMLGRNSEKRFLLVVVSNKAKMPAGFAGEVIELFNGGAAVVGELDAANAKALRNLFPWCAPKSLRLERTTMTIVDYIG